MLLRMLPGSGFIALLSLLACGTSSDAGLGPTAGLGLQQVATGLDFPLFLTAPPGDATRLFVVEKTGRIRIVKNGTLLTTPFLDLRTKVSGGSEQGLLGLAFHPQYATNGR